MSDESWNLPSRKRSSRKHPDDAAQGCSDPPEQARVTGEQGRYSADESASSTDLRGRLGKRQGCEDDCPSPEEINLQAQLVPVETGELALSGLVTHSPGATPKPWGAGLTWDDALAYTSLSPRQLRSWQRRGALNFRRVGRNGARVVLRRQLDDLMETVFGGATDDIGEDFDFG